MTPDMLALLAVLIGGGGLVAFLRYRSQNRVDDANAGISEADAVGRWQSLYDALQTRVGHMETDMTLLLEKDRARETEMSSLRDAARAAEASAAEARLEASRARTAKAESDTRVAELEADLARALKEAGDERHALRTDFAEYRIEQEQRELAMRQEFEARSTAYEATIADLTARVETLSAQLGNDRRSTDRRDTETP